MARTAVVFSAPVVIAIVSLGIYNAARFGSPLESGYAISFLSNESLIARRALGLFSIAQVPENLRLAILAIPHLRGSFPFALPDKYGMSMLLVSPGLLVAARAGIRPATQRSRIATAPAIPAFSTAVVVAQQHGFHIA